MSTWEIVLTKKDQKHNPKFSNLKTFFFFLGSRANYLSLLWNVGPSRRLMMSRMILSMHVINKLNGSFNIFYNEQTIILPKNQAFAINIYTEEILKK